jgi:predicted NAD/FAD-binding protein
MRIAIIGSGIAGLGCAWLLDQGHDITLYEADDRIGGHACTIDLPTPDGPLPVDTGFLVYNERTYPNLTALFDHLDVPTRATSMSFGVSIDQGRLEYAGGDSYALLFAQKRNLFRPGHHRMLLDIARFNSEALQFLEKEPAADEVELTLGAFLEAGGYGRGFTDHYLLPMAAAIWSATLAGIRAFPARSFIRFFANHGLLSMSDRPAWRTVRGGSRTYVEKLAAPFQDSILQGRAVRRLRRTGFGVELLDDAGEVRDFDAVVLACHADEALALIERPNPKERAILGSFTYQLNHAVLHQDCSLMPKRRSVWSSWNYLTTSARSAEVKVSVTYWLNRLQSLDSDHPALVTLNPIREPDPASVVRRFAYDHPQFTHAALRAQQRLAEIQGRDRLWFCGAHWGHGFHEDGLLSGLQVAAQLGVTPPWWDNVTPLQTVLPPPLPDVAAAGAD